MYCVASNCYPAVVVVVPFVISNDGLFYTDEDTCWLYHSVDVLLYVSLCGWK
jgi:hypothetical protein